MNAEAGTKLFLQDGMYFFKTITEQEFWLTIDEVENDPAHFRKQTAFEFFFYAIQINI
ncbi:MAG: hypothetical protein AABY22_24490 [Nanoarchaeota archaeon]